MTTDGRTTARLCAVGDLASGEARRFDVADLRIALVRIGDEFHAVGDRCSHEDFSLADGGCGGRSVRSSAPSTGPPSTCAPGAPCSLPATKPVPVYELVVAGGEVSVVVP